MSRGAPYRELRSILLAYPRDPTRHCWDEVQRLWPRLTPSSRRFVWRRARRYLEGEERLAEPLVEALATGWLAGGGAQLLRQLTLPPWSRPTSVRRLERVLSLPAAEALPGYAERRAAWEVERRRWQGAAR